MTLGCVLARLGDDVVLPAFLADGGQELASRFATWSRNDIRLEIDDYPLTQAQLPPQADYVADDLHELARQLCQNPPAPAASERIAVLFGSYYHPYPGAFGMMFDRGFATDDDPQPSAQSMASPREACAIFLNAIARLRPNDPDYQKEALYTTVHEMGHLFNLQHLTGTPNYMQPSRASAPFPTSAQVFTPRHRHMLEQCSQSWYVYPGGAPFGDVGDFGDDETTTFPGAAANGPVGLDLSVAMARREFWPFEPVELEVSLSVPSGARAGIEVPDCVDPGYEIFQIWLRDPAGETRRYRSPRRYCGPTQSRTVEPGGSFVRDVSLFGEAGGYTFRRAGAHQVWAEFHLPEGTVRSNVIDLLIRSADRSRLYRRARKALAAPKAARLLYHRLLRSDVEGVGRLQAFLTQDADAPSAPAVQYALGRAHAERALRFEHKSDRHPASEWLRRARDGDTLGEVQRRHADQIIAVLDSKA